jgi:glycosyltransferase involved in cell wall biosynthesis
MITVVMPTLRERWDNGMRRAAIESVQEQTFPAEGSIVLIQNETPWDARNIGLDMVKTPWTAFLDDDDWMLPGHLAALALGQWRSGADVVYSRPFESYNGVMTPREVGPFDVDRMREGSYIPNAILIRTDLAQTVRFEPRRDGRPSDWDFLLRCYDAGARFEYVDELTWVFRRHDGNTWSWKDQA